MKNANLPWHGWLIAVILILFGLGSGFDFTMAMLKGEEYYLASGMNDFQLNYYLNTPLWVNLFWALSVWGGLVAALSLLLDKRLSAGLFALTALGNLGYGVYVYGLSDGITAMGAIWYMPAVITFIHTAMVVYSVRQTKALASVAAG